MRRALRFLRLPGDEQRLAAEAALTLALVCTLLKTLPFRRVLRLLGLHEQATATTTAGMVDAPLAHAVGRAVARANRALPFPAVCLPQAAAAAVMLRRRGLAVEVRFGVAKRGDAVAAHAWSRCGDVLVSGGAGHAAYAPIATFRS